MMRKYKAKYVRNYVAFPQDYPTLLCGRYVSKKISVFIVFIITAKHNTFI